MTHAQQQSQRVMERRIAAGLIFDARQREYEAACWLGIPSNIAEATANVHSAFDAVLDATLAQIQTAKAQFGNAA